MLSRTKLGVVLALCACGEVKNTAKDAASSDTSMPMSDARNDGGFASGSLSFEELPQGTITIPHLFANGVRLTKPISGGSLTATDCKQASGFFGFGCSTQKQYIPDGMVFIGISNLGLNNTIIEFEFPADIAELSLALTNSNGMTGQAYTVTGLDANSAVKTSTMINTVAITGWATNRGTITSTGIRKVTISGTGQNAVVIDDIRWTVP